MELGEAVRRRAMVRTYDPHRPVAAEVVDRLLALAVRAPSAGNTQGRDLLVLSRPQDRELFWRASSDAVDAPDRWLAGMMTAPVLVLALADPGAYAARYAEADKARARAERVTGATSGASGTGGTDGPGGSAPGWAVPWWFVDVGMSALLLLLGAVDEGLGACLFGVPDDRHDAVRAALGVPADRAVVGVVSLGHAAPDRRSPSLRRARRPLADVAHDGRFGRPWSPSSP